MADLTQSRKWCDLKCCDLKWYALLLGVIWRGVRYQYIGVYTPHTIRIGGFQAATVCGPGGLMWKGVRCLDISVYARNKTYNLKIWRDTPYV